MQLSIFNLPALRRFSMGLNRTRTIDQIGLWKFFNKNFQPRLLRSRTLKTANKSLRRTSSCPLLCWWAQMDSNHRPISLRDFFEISKAFGRFSFFEPTNKPPCTTSSHPLFCWWAQMDSNHRPHAYQACALTNWAMSPFLVEINGFEPLTPCLQGRCSSQLSYTPIPKTTIRSSVLPCPPGTLTKQMLRLYSEHSLCIN